MKVRALLLSLLLLLTACGAPAEKPAAPAEPDALPEAAQPPLPALDLPGLKAAMTSEEYEVLESFLPVLEGNGTFRWTAGPYRGDPGAFPDGGWEDRDVTLGEFSGALWADNGPGTGEEGVLDLDRLAIADVVQSGSRDLVLLVRDAGYNYLVLHREGDAVYGTDLSVRWFMDLQENGMYVGSGGADDHTYCHMSFEDGRFAGQELARAAGGAYEIGGRSVAEEEFAAWEFETMVGGVTWYAPSPQANFTKIGFRALEEAMTSEEAAAFRDFLPALQGLDLFNWVSGPLRGEDWTERTVSLSEFRETLYEGSGGAPETLTLDGLALVRNANGGLDLVLRLQDVGGHYLILHREGAAVYGTDLPIRWYERLQENGVYIASGGAGANWYCKLFFEDGAFVQRELAQAVDGAYAIGGRSVTEEEFAVWEGETMSGDAVWRAP